VKRSLRPLRQLLWLSLFALTSACGLFANEFMSFDGRVLQAPTTASAVQPGP
jgi:hypothetical protein